MEALSGEGEFFGDSLRQRLTKLFELIDESCDGGFGTKDFLLFLVDRFALSDGFLHLSDTVEFLAECTEALVDEVEDWAF